MSFFVRRQTNNAGHHLRIKPQCVLLVLLLCLAQMQWSDKANPNKLCSGSKVQKAFILEACHKRLKAAGRVRRAAINWLREPEQTIYWLHHENRVFPPSLIIGGNKLPSFRGLNTLCIFSRTEKKPTWRLCRSSFSHLLMSHTTRSRETSVNPEPVF